MQYALYRQRQAYYNERIEYFEGAIRQNDATRKSYEDSLVKQQEQLEATKNIENMYIPDCGAVNRQPFPGTFSGGVWI